MAVRASAPIVRGILAAVDAAAATGSEERLERAVASARAVLPRAARRDDPGPVVPQIADDTATYENAFVRALFSSDAALLECSSPDSSNLLTRGNVAALDRGWRGRTPLGDATRVELRAHEAFVRCGAEVRGRGELVVDNCFAAAELHLECGGPNRERFAVVRTPRAALALFAPDGARWKQRTRRGGGTTVEQRIAEVDGEAAWAYFPTAAGEHMGAIEHAWQRYAHEPRVRLFRSSDEAVLVETCAPAAEEGWVEVSVRECDGDAAMMRVRSAGRMSEAVGAAIDAEYLVAPLAAFERRTLRVRF